MARVILNITSAELKKITGDVSFYRNLLDHRPGENQLLSLPDEWLLPRKAVRFFDVYGRPWYPSYIRSSFLHLSRRTIVNSSRILPGDVFLSHIHFPAFFPRPRFPVPLIWSTQGISPPEYYDAKGFTRYEDVVALYRRLGPRATVIMVWTHDCAERMIAECPELAGHTEIVRPFVPVRTASITFEPQGPLRLLFIGRDPERKGLPEILEALQALGPLAGELVFDIVSIPEAAKHIAPGNSNIHFHSNVSGDVLQDLFARADIFIMPTKAETFGFVLVEALAKGCAIISSDMPPLPEVVGPGGLCIPADSAEAIAGALRRLIEDRALLIRLKREGRKYFDREFSPEVVIGQLTAVIQRANSEVSP